MWAESAWDTGGQKEQEGKEIPLWTSRLKVQQSHVHSQLLRGPIPTEASRREGKHSERKNHFVLGLFVLLTPPEKQDGLRHREQAQMMSPTAVTPNASLAPCPGRNLLSTQNSALKTCNPNMAPQRFRGKEMACERIKTPLTKTPIRNKDLRLNLPGENEDDMLHQNDLR